MASSGARLSKKPVAGRTSAAVRVENAVALTAGARALAADAIFHVAPLATEAAIPLPDDFERYLTLLMRGEDALATLRVPHEQVR